LLLLLPTGGGRLHLGVGAVPRAKEEPWMNGDKPFLIMDDIPKNYQKYGDK
jgi:hypothetical protein